MCRHLRNSFHHHIENKKMEAALFFKKNRWNVKCCIEFQNFRFIRSLNPNSGRKCFFGRNETILVNFSGDLEKNKKQIFSACIIGLSCIWQISCTKKLSDEPMIPLWYETTERKSFFEKDARRKCYTNKSRTFQTVLWKAHFSSSCNFSAKKRNECRHLGKTL